MSHENTEKTPPGQLCKPCREARAIEHYHGIPAKYCARCRPIQEAAVLAETSYLSPGDAA